MKRFANITGYISAVSFWVGVIYTVYAKVVISMDKSTLAILGFALIFVVSGALFIWALIKEIVKGIKDFNQNGPKIFQIAIAELKAEIEQSRKDRVTILDNNNQYYGALINRMEKIENALKALSAKEESL